MNIVLSGSLGNIGRPLAKILVQNGHSITVISSKAERQTEIEALGAKAAIGSIEDGAFLVRAFHGADIVYLMETLEAAGGFFNKDLDYLEAIDRIVHHYKQAVLYAGIKKVIHLSSVGAHMNEGNGILKFHYNAENILRSLPEDVHIKFMRPVGFYTNMHSFIRTIKQLGIIVSNYGGDRKEPWVAPADIAQVIAEEIGKPFTGRSVRYIASDEVSPNEIAQALGAAIGKPDLQWSVITDEALQNGMIAAGMNPDIAKGFVAMQAAQGNGLLYEDYEQHKPAFGMVKLSDF
ncbi:MAG TPA: NAD(P)H-binding protein, partial [Chitinophagaceae bacterium]|nr:NAD(P)H-binding protein [Chitinophagaceae bacterium]